MYENRKRNVSSLLNCEFDCFVVIFLFLEEMNPVRNDVVCHFLFFVFFCGGDLCDFAFIYIYFLIRVWLLRKLSKMIEMRVHYVVFVRGSLWFCTHFLFTLFGCWESWERVRWRAFQANLVLYIFGLYDDKWRSLKLVSVLGFLSDCFIGQSKIWTLIV